MIKVDITGRKKLTFHVQVWGTNLTALRGMFVIVDGDAGDSGVEYRFEGKLENDTIQIIIPPLSHIIARPVSNDTVFRSYLEVMGEGLYNIPWKDEVLVKVKEAHSESIEQGEPKFETKKDDQTEQSILEIEVERKSEVDGKNEDGKGEENNEKDEKSNVTETKIHDIIRDMQKADVVKEVTDKIKPKSKEKKKKIIKKITPEVTPEVSVSNLKNYFGEEVKEEKVLKELKESIKEPEKLVLKRDKKRHEKKVIATLLSVANQ